MFNRNVIKMTALCLSFFALLSATVIAQKQDNSPLPEVLGSNIPGVDIIVRRKPGGIIAAKATTDKDGNFSFTLAPGEYTVVVGASSSLARQTPKRDFADRSTPARPDNSTRWISVEGHPYKFSLNGEGLTVGDASLLGDKPATGQGAAARTIRGIEASIAIKDAGVQRVKGVKISGKVVSAQ